MNQPDNRRLQPFRIASASEHGPLAEGDLPIGPPLILDHFQVVEVSLVYRAGALRMEPGLAGAPWARPTPRTGAARGEEGAGG